MRLDHRTAKCLIMVLAMLLAPLAGCVEGTEIPDQPTTDALSVELSSAAPADGAVDGRVVSATASGGESPYTYSWLLNGDARIGDTSSIEFSSLAPATHTVTVIVTDASGEDARADVLFTTLRANQAPSATLVLPATAYAGQDVIWSISATDADGDLLTYSIEFGDSTTASGASGTHQWASLGFYAVTATVSDPSGAQSVSQAEIIISADLPPTLSVLSVPAAEGNILLTSEEALSLEITASDAEDGSITLVVDWGEGGGDEFVTSDVMTHAYAGAGLYTISVTATDSSGQSTKWSAVAEVVDEIDESAVYAYFEGTLPEDAAIEQALDENGDGTVDDAEPAEDETGYDWEADFDEDGDGEADHDDGNIESWETKDEEDVEDVAESDDTNGGGRSAKDGDDDPLTDFEAHVNENETDQEIPDDEGMMDEDELMEDMFDGTEALMDNSEDNEAFDEDHYAEEIEQVDHHIWTETFGEDYDEDGVDESACERTTAAHWLDSDNDGNPERAVMYRVLFCTADRDADGTHDLFFYEVEALNAVDANDNGIHEGIEALHIIAITWLNGTDLDTNTVLVAMAGVDADEDGNAEGGIIVGATAREVDIGNDGVIEGSVIEYGIIAFEDANDDGTPEEALMMVHTAISLDLDGDGNVNHEASGARIVHALDRDADGEVDDLRAAEFGEERFDHNSDGITDERTAAWLGVRIVDRNFDGEADKISMATGVESEIDTDSDGVADTHSRYFVASVVKDWDADGNPEHAWWLAASTTSTDFDGDGLWDSQTEMGAGAVAYDWNDDGNPGYYAAAHVVSDKSGQTTNGWTYEGNAVWILRVWDFNSDGAPNRAHAVILHQVHWDNNTDGDWDTEWSYGRLWHGVDIDGDGDTEREVFVAYEAATSDDDADGEIEYSVEDITLHTRNTTLSDHVTHEYYFHSRNVKANISTAGIAQYENATLVAYETWDTAQRQETHAVVYVADSWDDDRDGVAEVETVHVYHDNRS